MSELWPTLIFPRQATDFLLPRQEAGLNWGRHRITSDVKNLQSNLKYCDFIWVYLTVTWMLVAWNWGTVWKNGCDFYTIHLLWMESLKTTLANKHVDSNAPQQRASTACLLWPLWYLHPLNNQNTMWFKDRTPFHLNPTFFFFFFKSSFAVYSLKSSQTSIISLFHSPTYTNTHTHIMIVCILFCIKCNKLITFHI